MKALCWLGTNRVAVEDVPDPRILNPRDAVLKITTTAKRTRPRPVLAGRGRGFFSCVGEKRLS